MIPVFGDVEEIVKALVFGGGGAELPETAIIALNTYETLASHYSYTWLSVTGKGVLMRVKGRSSSSLTSTYNISVQVDGGDIHRVVIPEKTSKTLLLPFETSLVVKGDYTVSDGGAYAIAVLE